MGEIIINGIIGTTILIIIVSVIPYILGIVCVSINSLYRNGNIYGIGEYDWFYMWVRGILLLFLLFCWFGLIMGIGMKITENRIGI
ncbi:MAG TPA: hypothetical protein PKC87_01120 [Candidatus Absconditabacterales bacterium]|nr:hypothetical protein [Candidatus Absconditabacterales bacterium]